MEHKTSQDISIDMVGYEVSTRTVPSQCLSNDSDNARAVNFTNSVVHLEEIELVDMRGHGNIDDRRQLESSDEMKVPLDMLHGKVDVPKENNYNDKRHIIEMQISGSQRNENNDRLATISVNMNSPELVDKTDNIKGVTKSLLSVQGKSTKGVSHEVEVRWRNKVDQIRKRDVFDDDDDEISMGNLLELLGTVRQYAKEIHEIYDPIKKDEEERIRKRIERKSKEKCKDKKNVGVKDCNKQQPTAIQQEVGVEIHKVAEKSQEKLQGGKGKHSKQELILLSKRLEFLSTAPVASLHMENEKLSSTWPRGQRRFATRERFWSDIALNKYTSCTPSLSCSSYRPQIPAEWSEINIKNETETANSSFRRIYKSRDSRHINSYGNTSPLVSPQHSGFERQSETPRHSTVPTIIIIPSQGEPKRKTLASTERILLPTNLDRHSQDMATTMSKIESKTYDMIIPTAPVVYGEGEAKQSETQSKNPRVGGKVNSSSTMGLRRRKSVDFMLEKY